MAATPRSNAAVTALVAYFCVVLYLMTGPCDGEGHEWGGFIAANLVHLRLVVCLMLLATKFEKGMERERDRETERQRDRHTDTQTHIENSPVVGMDGVGHVCADKHRLGDALFKSETVGTLCKHIKHSIDHNTDPQPIEPITRRKYISNSAESAP
jgi:hypothetical protein